MALEFLTVLRLRPAKLVSTEDVARAQLWYPAVGLLIGGCVALADHLLAGRLAVGPRAALLLALLCGLPGLLHLDGLADCADGLLSLATPERRLEIMRDSRTGAFGVAVIGLYLVLAYAALEALAGAARTPCLIAAPVVGRTAMIAVMALIPYARREGLASGFTAAARSWIGLLALLSAGGICVLAAGGGGLVLLGVGAVVAASLGGFAFLRVGGITGDVTGAAGELAQLAALLAGGALQTSGWLRPWV